MQRSLPTAKTTTVLLLVLAAATLSWAYVLSIEPHGMDMGALLRPRAVAGEHAEMVGQGSSEMEMPAPMEGMVGTHRAMPVTLFLTGWVAMMAAMMLPAIVPMVMLVARWSRSRNLPSYRLVAFVGGYLLVWGAAGAFYYALVELFTRSVPATDSGVRIAASVLLVAGLYQLTPMKERCLTACRTPLGFLMTHGGRMSSGTRGYLEVGARHSLFCLGCCWMLMVILVLVGVMNVFWMLVVASVILIEKVTRFGAIFSRLAGLTTAVAGATLVIAPGLLG